MKAFLYGQTEYNLLNNSIHLNDYVQKGLLYGYELLTITDENMYGHYKFYKKCVESGITPLIGLELKMHEYSLLLYALNIQGYSNLCKIASEKKISQDFKIDYVYANSSGLFAVLIGNMDYYFELKNNIQNIALGIDCTDILGYNFSLKHNILAFPVLNTCYLNKEDRIVYETLSKIGNNQIKDGDLYFKNKEELEESFSGMESLFDNLDILYKMIDLKLENRKVEMPKYSSNTSLDSKEYLKALSYKGLEKRLSGLSVDKNLYFKRLDYELSIIDRMGYNDYFLIVWDFIKYSKTHDILVGPGRGSGVGSLTAYSIGITSIDPIKYNLLFERFLNPERLSMPDIDTDLPDNKRNDVIEYVHSLYGDNHVCYITAFDTFKIKSSMRDLGRVLKIDDKTLTELSNQIIHSLTEKYGSRPTSEETIYVLNDLMKNVNGVAKNFMFIASKMEGLPRHTSTHASVIIISSVDLNSFIPLQNGINDIKQSQLDATDLESIGLLKMDFLGIKNLSIIDNIMNEIDGYNSINLYNKIPLDDKKTYELLSSGDTLGIFQLESSGIIRTIMKLEPHRIEDVVALLALYRPGPMDNIDEFIARKHGKKFEYIHPDLSDILEETYGIIVYQEQIMLIAQKFAGYSLGEADVLRRAVSKKKEEILISEREKFVNASVKKGYSNETANKIYDDIVKFANYGFNKSHSVGYAMFSYVMAYFKANYPIVFVSKILNNVIGSIKDTKAYLMYAKKCGLKILPPSINYASNNYVVHGNKIFLPFTSIKGVGIQQTNDILNERRKGVFKSFKEFKERVNIQESTLKALIYCGAFDEFGQTKKSLIDDMSQNSLYIDSFLEDRILSLDELDFSELQQREYEYLGFNLKYDIYSNIDKYKTQFKATSILDLKQNYNYKIIASFQDSRELLTKNNELMLVGNLYDGISTISTVIFPKNYINLRTKIKYNTLYVIDGRVNYDNERKKLQVIINDIDFVK